MNTGTIIYLLLMGWTLIIYGGLTYLFAKKKDYMLLSGFHKRPEEEQEYLKESGYLDAIGKLFTITFWIFAATFILGLLPIPFGFEIGISIFTILLFGGLVWIQRYEVPHKRRKMTWIMGSISGGTLLFIGIIIAVGYIENDINVDEETFEITGMYGVEWDIDAIQHVELLEEMPEVIARTNGISSSNLQKGRFKLEEPYGTGVLFVQRNEDADVLYIATEEEYVMISRDAEETRDIYEKLMRVWE